VPSIPRYDVFWPVAHIVVSERLRDLLQRNEITGAVFEPLVLGPIGLAEPTAKLVLRKNREFDDRYYERIPCVPDPKSCGDFFHMTFSHATQSSEPGVVEKCPICGASNWHIASMPQPERELLIGEQSLPRKYIPDADIFWSHVFTGGFIIRDCVRKLIPDEYLQNCGVKRIRILDA
jgi:hypothetical protein